MTVEHLEDEKLQRYFDGETSPGESTVVRHHLDACGVCTSRLQKLEKLRGLFTEMVDIVGAIEFHVVPKPSRPTRR